MSVVVRTAQAIETVISKIEKTFANIGMFLIVALTFFGTADVVGRYIFNNPISGALEIQLVMMGLTIFLGWAYTLRMKQHIALDIFFGRYPLRAQAIMSFFALFISLVFFGLIAWRAGILATMDWESGRIIRSIFIPVYPFKYVVTLGAFFLCLECIIQMVHLFPKMMEKKEG
jgi:TRAP-type C4-dicarboxylate transport system permease small subunit